MAAQYRYSKRSLLLSDDMRFKQRVQAAVQRIYSHGIDTPTLRNIMANTKSSPTSLASMIYSKTPVCIPPLTKDELSILEVD